MKTRIFALCLVVLFCLGLCGCEWKSSTITKTENGAVDDAALYRHGVELAALLEEMLSTPEYYGFMTTSQEMGKVITPYIHADFSQPENVYKVIVPKNMIPLLIDAGEMDMDKFSEPLRKFWEHRALNYLPTMLNAQSGGAVLAAASMFTISNTWAGETLDEDCYLLYFYPDACPILATFCGGNGFVEGSAMLLLADNLTGDSVEAVDALLQSLGLSGVQVDKLEID